MAHRKANSLGRFDQRILLVDGKIPSALDVIETHNDEADSSERYTTIYEGRFVPTREPIGEQAATDQQV